MYEVVYENDYSIIIGYFTREEINFLKQHTDVIILSEREYLK